MNLIANSGIQFFSFPLEVNLNDNFKMYFHEWLDLEEGQLKFEIAHKFAEEEIWVSKKSIYNLLGLGLTDGKVGRIEDGVFKPYKWEEIKEVFEEEGNSIITPMESEEGGTDCFQITNNRCRWEKFENRWLPFPFFGLSGSGNSEFAPTNWCRFKLVPETVEGNSKKYNLLLAFDTRTKYEDEGFEGEDLMETPVFASNYDKSKDFALCKNEFSLVDFCSESSNCEWVDEYILGLFHNVKNIEDLNVKKPKMNYLAQYIYILKYIQQLNILPKITLFSDKNVAFGDVDLVVDMGNSRTCAVLFDNHDFTKVESLELQNFSNPFENGKINKSTEPFDMRMAFREADFGVNTLKGSLQFVYPSFVRLGTEANDLIHKAVNLNSDIEKVTTFSSPKRYLWDNKPQQKDWEFLKLGGEQSSRKLVQIKGVSEQLKADGTLNVSGETEIGRFYSRKALMTFSFLEILTQAKMQINSYKFRHKWGEENKPRRIGRIIVTCPTAMSRVEQTALRKSAEDAAIILDRFYNDTFDKEMNEKLSRNSVQVIPAVKNLVNNEERTEWIYDEATCSQFVYLFAEITKRYKNNCEEYFDFYGKFRNDLGDYAKKSLTIGTIDIGAGTTDLMIASYKYEGNGQCRLTPVPLFWESFYIAGDDLLKNLIQNLIIEGQYATITKHLQLIQTPKIIELILDFFGQDNARQSIEARQMRSEFNLQVSVPVVTYFLELLKDNKIVNADLTFDDIFNEIKPSESVLNYFRSHFDFSIEDLIWNYDKAVITKMVESTFDSLVGKISTVLAYYGCDIVLLSGRPSSLKPLYDLFLKYYSVSPNRLITLNNYRIGTWYPFQNGEGYFKDSKSIVAVGAMIGNYASTRGSLEGFTLDLSQLSKDMLPTTEYFSKSENETAFITPENNNVTLEVSLIPMRIWTRQLNSQQYPTRPFYLLDFNENVIKEKIRGKLATNDEKTISDGLVNELERLRRLVPFKINIIRESYLEDKENLSIQSIQDKDNEDIPISYFTLQVQSMSESGNYWLDSGEFVNLNINHN